MIFDKQEGKFLVKNGGVGIFLGSKLIQQIEHDLKEGKSHDLGSLENSLLNVNHDLVDLIEGLLNVQRVRTPDLDQELNRVQPEFLGVLGT
jgi:hypothetical protein